MIDASDKHLTTVYEVIAERRTAFDTLMWQVPAIALTAQAFLLTIAFGDGSSQIARIVSGVLSIVVAAVTTQTMLKHQANELTDSLILQEIEKVMKVRLGDDAAPHGKPADRGEAVGNRLFNRRLVKAKSAYLWVGSLVFFGAAGIVAIVLAVFWPDTLAA